MSAGANRCTTCPTVPDTTTWYFHADQVGSNRLVTVPSPSVANAGYPNWTATYFPYGSEKNQEISVNEFKFGTYMRDEAPNLPNLDYAHFRYYSSQFSRFQTPDPLGDGAADPANPQSWNRYGYVGNNPMNFLDPSGLFLSGEPKSPPPMTCGGGFSGVICEMMLNYFGRSFKGDPRAPRRAPRPRPTNNRFTLGVRAPGQTFGNCMQQHAQDYSIAGTVDLVIGTDLKENPAAAFFAGNHVSGLFLGSGGEAAMTGAHAVPTAATEAMGSTLAFGRYAPNVALDLNKAGNAATSALGWNTNLAAKSAVQGAEKVFNMGLSLETRLGTDVGFSLAEAMGCAIHQ